jgi:hypothetical protein
MLTDNHQSFLFRALRANTCLLFVGAGFSADASNAVGSRIPAGDQLAAELWQWLGYEGDYDRTPLSEMFEAALRSGRPMADLKGFLEDRLLARQVPNWYEIPTRIFWNRIYGTNADDVIERSFIEVQRATAAVKSAALSPRVLDERVEVRPGTVNVATMHLAKGLEFRVVAVMACDDEVLHCRLGLKTSATTEICRRFTTPNGNCSTSPARGHGIGFRSAPSSRRQSSWTT